MSIREAWIVAPLLLVAGGSVCAQPLPSDSSMALPSASMAQAGTAVWQRWPYGDSPKRELTMSVSICGLTTDANALGGGLTYTRNINEDAALEAIVDVGMSHRSLYDADLDDYRQVGPSHPFGLVVAQLRAGRERMPGLNEFMTFGVARIFGDHDHMPSGAGRAIALGAGLRASVGGGVAIRLDIQGLFFHRALGGRASAGVVIGLD